jgi:altronate dehydratase
VFQAHGFSKQVVALARENEAHSDDELAEWNAESVDVVYYIKEKEGSAKKVTAFFRMADEECKQMNRSKRRHLKLANLCFSFFTFD